MKSLGRAFALLAVAGILSGCSDDDSSSEGPSTAGTAGSGGGGSGADAVSFAADIHPILTLRCSDQASQCHSADRGPYQPGHAAPDVDAAYAATQGQGSTGEPVYERMLARVTADGPTSMPPPYANPPCEGAIGTPGCLSEAELALLEAWIEQGAPP